MNQHPQDTETLLSVLEEENRDLAQVIVQCSNLEPLADDHCPAPGRASAKHNTIPRESEIRAGALQETRG